MAIPYSNQQVSAYNQNPPADNAEVTAANALKWAKHVDKLSDPLKTFIEAVNTELLTAFTFLPDHSRTAAEITAGITPTNFQYEPGHVFRWMTDAQIADVLADTASLDVGTALQNASDSGAGKVIAPDGTYLFATGLTPPNEVAIVGDSRRGTVFRYTGTGIAIKFGTSDSVLNVGCALQRCAINLVDKASTAIKLNSTNAAYLDDIYIEGLATPFDATRSNVGVTVDGANISAFRNIIQNIDCNHIHIGYQVTTAGTTQATRQTFINCSSFGDVATDADSIGYNITNTGNGTSVFGGNLENLGKGIRHSGTALSMPYFGVRFEGNTKDIVLESGAATCSFFGLINLVKSKIDNSSGNSHNFVATVDVDGVTSYTDLAQLLINASASTQKLGVEGNIELTGNPSGNKHIITDQAGTGPNSLIVQAGGGSGGFGGGVILRGHTHSENPGGVVIGLSSGSAGEVQVRDQGAGGGNILFKIKNAGEVFPQNTAAAIYSGSGTPEAAVTAAIGSLFMRTDGGAATSVYVKESGAGNTGWVAK